MLHMNYDFNDLTAQVRTSFTTNNSNNNRQQITEQLKTQLNINFKLNMYFKSEYLAKGNA